MCTLYHYKSLFKAADHIHVGVREYEYAQCTYSTVYTREVHEKEVLGREIQGLKV
jgi:hypothetical protein